jgi:signal transduction histidine kinase
MNAISVTRRRAEPAWGEPARDEDDLGVRLPRIVRVAILSDGILLALLLFLEIRSGWSDVALHISALTGIFGLATVALASRRWLRCERTAPASLARVGRALEVAETANLAKSRYLANVSHEFRSPLNAIYGYAQLLERDGVSVEEASRVIRRSAEHLTSLVEGLLDISQVENGMLRVRSDVVRLGPFIEQIASMMRPAAAAKGLDFVYEPPERLPALVRMDQNRLRQVLINLLSNAIKFTDRGKVTLRVGYVGQIATFDIIDTGPGISAADGERIFDPFERGGGADAHRHAGAGLGLAISRAIVDILGGKLELKDMSGAGSCFRVTVMLGTAAGRPAPEAREARVLSYDGNRRSILVVEDDFEQRTFLEHLLGGLGFAVVTAANGESALELCGKVGIDLAIIDVGLPGISGWETAAQLRARLAHDVRILMLSADCREQTCYRSPIHDLFLVKPVEFGALTNAIGNLLNLCWNYEAAERAEPRTGPEGRGTRGLPEAALVHVGRIRELLRIGHVRGIEAEIRQLAETTPEAADLAGELYSFLDRFDLSGMERTLEPI